MQQLFHDSLLVYSEIRDGLKETIETARLVDPKYAAYSRMQMYSYAERCQSVSLLLQEWKLWDCDIIMRTALECATRFLYVSIAAPDERSHRIDEYTIHLNEIEDIQRSERAKAFVSTAPHEDDGMLVGGIVLSEKLEHELRARWPKTKRAALKQKWSFSEIASEVTKFHEQHLDLRKFQSFLHAYGMSSHLIHADQTAMDLVSERTNRHPDERALLTKAHFARLATEPTSILFLCWSAMCHSIQADPPNIEVAKNLMALNNQADTYHRAFAESQASKYAASGTK